MAGTPQWAHIVGIVRIGVVVQVVAGLGLGHLELRADDHVNLGGRELKEVKRTYDW